jgi:hypothetical protein
MGHQLLSQRFHFLGIVHRAQLTLGFAMS